MASCGVANVRWASFGAACSRAVPTTRPTATSCVSRRGLSFESIKLVFRMIRSYRCPPPPPPPRMPAATTTTHTAATTSPREKPPPRLRAGPMLEYPWSLCVRAALPSRTPPKALRFWAAFARRNLPIAHPLASGLSGASGLRLSGRSASLQILAHVAAIAVGQGGVRIRHAAAMRCIVGPCASSTQAGAASGVEIVAMNEAVIDKDAVAAPAEPPTPSAPSTPSAAKIQSHRYAMPKGRSSRWGNTNLRMDSTEEAPR